MSFFRKSEYQTVYCSECGQFLGYNALDQPDMICRKCYLELESED